MRKVSIHVLNTGGWRCADTSLRVAEALEAKGLYIPRRDNFGQRGFFMLGNTDYNSPKPVMICLHPSKEFSDEIIMRDGEFYYARTGEGE